LRRAYRAPHAAGPACFANPLRLARFGIGAALEYDTRAGVLDRKEERERTSLVRRALDANLTAE